MGWSPRAQDSAWSVSGGTAPTCAYACASTMPNRCRSPRRSSASRMKPYARRCSGLDVGPKRQIFARSSVPSIFRIAFRGVVQPCSSPRRAESVPRSSGVTEIGGRSRTETGRMAVNSLPKPSPGLRASTVPPWIARPISAKGAFSDSGRRAVSMRRGATDASSGMGSRPLGR